MNNWIYDPRTGHNEQSDNPALILFDILLNNGYEIVSEEVTIVCDVANYCDELVSVSDYLDGRITNAFA